MRRRAFLALLSCLPLAWRTKFTARSDYLPPEAWKMEPMNRIFPDVSADAATFYCGRVGYESADGRVNEQEFVWTGPATSQWVGCFGEMHRPGWLNTVRVDRDPRMAWEPIRRIWPIVMT